MLWLKQLSSDFDTDVPSCKVLHDSTTTIQIANNPLSHEKVKHMNIITNFCAMYVFICMIMMSGDNYYLECLYFNKTASISL